MSSGFVSTRQQRFACARLPDPHLTPHGCLFLDRSPQQSSANAARGGLKPPPAGRLRRATTFITRTAPITRRPITYLSIGLLSLFGTHARAKSSVRRLTWPDSGVERHRSGAKLGPSRRRPNRQVALTWAGVECSGCR